MPKPFLFASPIVLKTIAFAGCAAFLCVSSGCRSVSRNPLSRHSVSSTASHGPSQNLQRPYETSVVDDALVADDASVVEEASPFTEDPNAGLLMPMTEDEVVAVYRKCGGKLRPNDSGAIVEIDLSFSEIADSQLGEITVFPEVAELDLTGTNIQNSGLAPLRSLSNLRSVKLKGTKITSDGLRLLSQVHTLVLIDASNTAVSDDGLLDAHKWVNLRYLSLNNTAVSDIGLQHLASLQNLKGLSVINTAVTEDGVLGLKKSLPNCLIVAQTERKVSRATSTDSLPRLPNLPAPDSAIQDSAPTQQLAQIVTLARCQPHLAVHLSRVYTTAEQWSEAVQILESAVVAAPNDLEIHAALGEALARSGRPEEALVHFQRCVSEADAKYRVGIIMYERTLEKCERYFDDVLRTDPSLDAAVLRRERIQQELASLSHHHSQQGNTANNGQVPEIIPAPSMRNASSTRQLPAR